MVSRVTGDRTGSRLSRVVSRVLRHEPWAFELELDEQGWVPVTALVAALRQERRWSSLTIAEVETMVAGCAKQRYELREGRIRAMYGHSVPRRIERVPATPPSLLFHGTSPATARVIRSEGLRPMGRQYVHLSVDRDMAWTVGARKAPDPVILVVDVRAALAAGVAFYAGNEKVWLADAVPPGFIADDVS